METAEQAPAPPVRIDWNSEEPEERRREVCEFIDPKRPGRPFVIELQQPDPMTDFEAGTIAAEAIGRHVTGDPVRGTPPFPFTINGEPQKTTAQFWYTVAEVAALQPDPWSLPFDRYSVDDLAQMAYKRRGLWLKLWKKSRELVKSAEEDLPNA
jgi:hypothetical protein